jgi:hypothetical protein
MFDIIITIFYKFFRNRKMPTRMYAMNGVPTTCPSVRVTKALALYINTRPKRRRGATFHMPLPTFFYGNTGFICINESFKNLHRPEFVCMRDYCVVYGSSKFKVHDRHLCLKIGWEDSGLTPIGRISEANTAVI